MRSEPKEHEEEAVTVVYATTPRPDPRMATPTWWRGHLDIVAQQMPGDLDTNRTDLATKVAGYMRAYAFATRSRDDKKRAHALDTARGRLTAIPGATEEWVIQWHVLLELLPDLVDKVLLARWLRVTPP